MSPHTARHDDSAGVIDAVQHTLCPTQARSESRLSTYSSNSTSCLVNNGDVTPGDRYGSPFFWNLPSNSTTERKQKLETGISARFAHTWRGWRVIVFGSWVNILLVLIPVSLILPLVVPTSLGAIFILCALAMIPLVKLHDLVTRELALRIGGTKTGLLNASMSNMVELVIAISALRRCELRVVQSSLIGSILSKLLLVLGMCFFAGGLRFSKQEFDASAMQVHSSLLSISVGAVLLPAAYHFSIGGRHSSTEQDWDILRMSYGVSVVLLCIYASYLLFQLWSHKHLYQDPSIQSNKHAVKFPKDVSFRPDIVGRWARDSRQPAPAALIARSSPPYSPCRMMGNRHASSSEVTLALSDVSPNGDKVYEGAIPAPAANSTVKLVPLQTSGIPGGVPMSRDESSDSGTSYFATSGASSDRSLQNEGNEEQKSQKSGRADIRDEKLPKLSWPVTLLLLVVVTVLVAAIADCLVNSMDGISSTIKKEWVGLILLPAVSSIAECVTAVNVSVKDQLTLSISVAVGSTIQTALFVIPFMVILAWVMNKPLALLFDPFECVVLYVAVQTMTNVVADAKSSWLHGVILLGLYVIIAVAFWFYPVSYHFSEMAACSAT